MKIRVNKNLLIFFIPTLLALGGLLLGHPAHAAFEWAGDILIGLLGFIISALGLILVLVVQGLVLIASWQTFIKAEAVMLGWVIVRDICNMFFVVVLMVIAFGTILNIPDYSYKKWLPKLVLFAVLINFSKTICGLMIDVSQVVMLTFVNAFKDIGGANLTQVLGITDILTISEKSGDVSQWVIIGAYFLGLIYMLVAIVVIATMIMMLAMRIVMIWIYVVLSPAAYLLAAFPGGKSYSSKWWDEFIKNLIVGPVLAFFIWLSLASLTAEATIKSFQNSAADGNAASDISNVTGGESLAVAGVEASTPSALIKYVIGIGMLVGGLMVSQQIGGAAGGLAGKGMSALQKGQKIGLAGVGAVTGYRYASGVLKSYQSMRKNKREEKYTNDAIRLSGSVGKVKQTVAKPINIASQFVKDNTWGRSGVRAKNLTQEAARFRDRAEQEQYNFKNKEGAIGNFSYDQNTDSWQDRRNPALSISNDVMGNRVTNRVRTANRIAENRDLDADKNRVKQAKMDKLVKYGSLALGGVAGFMAAPVLGGSLGFLSAAAGSIGGGIVPGKINRGIKNSGNIDLDIASGFRAKQVLENKEKMKQESDEDVVAIMNNGTKDAFTRTAAALEAMDRKLLTLSQVQNKKNEIKREMGGTSADGSWKDKKLGSYVENTIDKNYVGAGRMFDNLSSQDSDIRDKAKRQIYSKFETGGFSLDLDSGSLEKGLDILAKSMKTSDFVNQFKALKDSTKKDVITRGLANLNIFEAREKLSRVKDMNMAFGNDQLGKERALGNMSYDDILDVFQKGTAVQQNAISNAVASSNQQTKIDIFINAKNKLSGSSPVASDLRLNLGI